MAAIKFRTGEPQVFPGARKEAKERGYPDVPTYLWATGQVDQYCEEVPQEEVDQYNRAQQARLECLRIARSLNQ